MIEYQTSGDIMAIREDNKEILMTYDALKSRGLPTRNLERNAATLKIIQTDYCEPGEGIYKPSTNTIFYGTYNTDTILHELIHVASYDGTNEEFYIRGNRHKKCPGFAIQDSEAKGVGFCLSEGFSDLFCMLFFNNGIVDREKLVFDKYYSSLLLSRLLSELTSLDEIGQLFFYNNFSGFVSLLENKIGDHDNMIISLSDDVYNFDSESTLLNMMNRMNKVILTKTIIELSYRNIYDRDLDLIFKKHIKDYFENDNKNTQITLKKLKKAKKEYCR